MKKYILALLVGVSLLSMQAASAATLSLTNVLAGSVTTASGTSVSGTATGEALTVFGFPLPFSVSNWSFTLDADSEVSFGLTGGLPFSAGVFDNSGFTPPEVYQFDGATGSAVLTAGTYWFGVFSGFGNVGTPYDLTISVVDNSTNEVPLPASLWLFGSALMGLFGAARRKSKAGFAA